MRRSTFITYDQLKVGLMILLAMAIMVVAIFKLGQQAKLFSKRYTLVAFVPSTSGLREGAQVTLAGQLVGAIKTIDFLPVDRDTTKNLRITVEVDQAVTEQVRRDSRAVLRSVGLLGDKLFDITVGTPGYRTLHDGDTLTLSNALDIDAVLKQASGTLYKVDSITGTMQRLVNGVSNGQGTMGQLVTSRTLYDQLNTTLASTNGLMVRLQNPRGTIGRFLDDPALYNNLNRVLGSADTVVAQLTGSQGTVGKLLRDDQLYTKLVSTVSSLDTLVGSMSKGNGTVQRLFTDQELYNRLLSTVTELNTVLVDVRRDPRRYTKGLITVF
ncbi:MAG TPA: MlaD family protein [Gemmatimonadaceae bacterium]|nr:MlaD family protein [Gemmatimonadaceae bacterium]